MPLATAPAPPSAHRAARPVAPSRAATLAFAAAGALFVIYPALRPYSSETGLDGARAFASWQWTAAHLAGVLGFVLLAQTVGRLRLGRLGPVAVSLGATMVLPYYGAEVFGVGAVGRRAVDLGTPSLVGLVDDVRYGAPAVVLFAVGLGLLALGGAALGITLWRGGARVAGALLLIGLVAYLPQFYLPPTLRIAHGVVLGLGLALTAIHVSSRRTPIEAG